MAVRNPRPWLSASAQLAFLHLDIGHLARDFALHSYKLAFGQLSHSEAFCLSKSTLHAIKKPGAADHNICLVQYVLSYALHLAGHNGYLALILNVGCNLVRIVFAEEVICGERIAGGLLLNRLCVGIGVHAASCQKAEHNSDAD